MIQSILFSEQLDIGLKANLLLLLLVVVVAAAVAVVVIVLVLLFMHKMHRKRLGAA